MRAAVLRYRVMAYITGVLIIVIVFAGVPLQLAANNTIITNQVATAHGLLYIVYIIVAWLLALRLRLRPAPTVLLLLAGTVPVMTFVVERWLTRRHIEPALAAAAQQATPTGGSGGPGGSVAADGDGGERAEEPGERVAAERVRPGGRFGQWLHGA